MWHDDRPRHSDAECQRLLDRFLLSPEALLAVLAPQGWHLSPLRLAFHPTPEQVAEETERMRANLDRLQRLLSRGTPERAEGAPRHFREEAQGEAMEDASDERAPAPRPDEPEREIVELVGTALWDVFSDNHTVVDPDGVAFDLGSFRGSAGFIAESIDRRYAELAGHGYLDFYMGSLWLAERADLRPVYRWIFQTLHAEGCDWIYAFPRLQLIDLGGRASEDDLSAYDPSEAVRAELEEAERREKIREMEADLERAHEDTVRRARESPLPATVEACRDVFGALPEGWPHRDM